jgi:hypothetical protein
VFKNELSYITYTLGLNIEGRYVNKDVVQKLKLHNGKWLLLLPPNGEATIAVLKRDIDSLSAFRSLGARR